MSRAYAKIVNIVRAVDRYDMGYWRADIEMIEPASGSASVPLDDRLPAYREIVGKTAIVENYGPGAPILFIVGILDETPASLIEKLAGEAKAAVELSKPDAQKSDLEVVKAMFTRAEIHFVEEDDGGFGFRLNVKGRGFSTWIYFSAGRQLADVRSGKT